VGGFKFIIFLYLLIFLLRGYNLYFKILKVIDQLSSISILSD